VAESHPFLSLLGGNPYLLLLSRRATAQPLVGLFEELE